MRVDSATWATVNLAVSAQKFSRRLNSLSALPFGDSLRQSWPGGGWSRRHGRTASPGVLEAAAGGGGRRQPLTPRALVAKAKRPAPRRARHRRRPLQDIHYLADVNDNDPDSIHVVLHSKSVMVPRDGRQITFGRPSLPRLEEL